MTAHSDARYKNHLYGHIDILEYVEDGHRRGLHALSLGRHTGIREVGVGYWGGNRDVERYLTYVG